MRYSCTVNSEDKTKLTCARDENSSYYALKYTLSSFTDGTDTLTLAFEQTSVTIRVSHSPTQFSRTNNY